MSNLTNIISSLIEVDRKQNTNIKNLSGVISGLNYSTVGGSGKFIQAIQQNTGKISAVINDLTAQNVSRTATASLTGTNVQTVLNDLNTKINNVAASAIIINGLSAIQVTGDSIEKTIALQIAQTDKFLKQSDAGLYATIGISSVVPEGQGIIAKKYFLTGKDGQKIDGTQIDIPKDQYLSGMSYNPTTKQLTIVYYTISGTTASTVIALSGLVDTYTGASGIELISSNIFVGKVDNTSQSYLTVGTSGFKLSGIQSFVSSSIKPLSDVLAGYTEPSSIMNAIDSKLPKLTDGNQNNIVTIASDGLIKDSQFKIGTEIGNIINHEQLNQNIIKQLGIVPSSDFNILIGKNIYGTSGTNLYDAVKISSVDDPNGISLIYYNNDWQKNKDITLFDTFKYESITSGLILSAKILVDQLATDGSLGNAGINMLTSEQIATDYTKLKIQTLPNNVIHTFGIGNECYKKVAKQEAVVTYTTNKFIEFDNLLSGIAAEIEKLKQQI